MKYRKATFADVESIHKIINEYAENGLMLSRSRNVLYETLRDMTVVEDNGNIIGVGALHLIWNELAEVRTLAVLKEYMNRGIGRNIIEKLTSEAYELGVKTLFTLTYRPEVFAKLGFTEQPKETLSHKVWKDCINCAKFPNCDEIALVKHL